MLDRSRIRRIARAVMWPCLLMVVLSSCGDDGGGGGGGGTPWHDRDPLQGAYLRVQANIGSINGVRIAVSDSGIVYVKEAGGGATPDKIHKVDVAGNVTRDFITGLSSKSGGDIICLGEDVLSGGSSASGPSGTFIHKWDAGTTNLSTLFSTGSVYYGLFAAAAEDELWYADVNGSEIRKVIGASTSTQFLAMRADAIHADERTGDLYFADGEQLYRRPFGDPPSIQWLHTFPAGTYINEVTTGPDGFVYVACYAVPILDPYPFSGGAVWKIAPDGSEAVPLIDDFAVVYDMDYDPSTGDLVLAVGTLLLRARTDASDSAYHYDWMDMAPVDGAGLSVFADVGAGNVGRMAVTTNGDAYIMESGGGAADNPIHRVDAVGTVTLDFLASQARNGGDIVAFGNELIFGGSRASAVTGTYIEHWISASPTQLFYTSDVYYYGIAASAVSDDSLFYSARSGANAKIYKTVNGTTSTEYSAVKTDHVFVNPSTGHLLYASGPELRRIRSDNQDDELIFTIPGAELIDIAVDPAGAMYVVCTDPLALTVPAPYTRGAVWKILDDGSKGRAVVNNFTFVRQAAIDPDVAQNEIVILAATGQLHRTDVTTP